MHYSRPGDAAPRSCCARNPRDAAMAERVGYDSEPAFSRAFKRYAGDLRLRSAKRSRWRPRLS